MDKSLIQRNAAIKDKSKKIESSSPIVNSDVPKSRYAQMKSKRHQLDTILNEYSEQNGDNNNKVAIQKQLNPFHK